MAGQIRRKDEDQDGNSSGLDANNNTATEPGAVVESQEFEVFVFKDPNPPGYSLPDELTLSISSQGVELFEGLMDDDDEEAAACRVKYLYKISLHDSLSFFDFTVVAVVSSAEV